MYMLLCCRIYAQDDLCALTKIRNNIYWHPKVRLFCEIKNPSIKKSSRKLFLLDL